MGPHRHVGSREQPVGGTVVASGQEGWLALGGSGRGMGALTAGLGCLGHLGGLETQQRGQNRMQEGVVFGFCYTQVQEQGQGRGLWGQ